MKRLISGWIILSLLAACATGGGRGPDVPPYDPQADIDLYLSTADVKVEESALHRLKENNISHEQVKAYLRTLAVGRDGLPGLHMDGNHVRGSQSYPYALYVPESPAPAQPQPLIVILHGMGGSGGETISTWVRRLNDEFIILCPSYPMGAWWTLSAEEMVLELIDEVRADYPVDPDRVFLAGLSNGAIGTYMLWMFYPDHFAGIVPIAGAVTERYMHFLVNLNNTPVYSIQGAYDPIFPIQLSRRIYKILTDLKYPLVYREHTERGTAHGGHFLPESEVPDLVAWLREQRRDTHPDVLRVIREENHMGPIHWARVSRGVDLAALQIPGPEPETLNIKSGKIATMIAVHKEKNLFEVLGKNLLEHELYFSDETVDLDKPVKVTFQELREENNKFVTGPKVVSFEGMVERDLGVLLRGFKERRDPNLLYDAMIRIAQDAAAKFASLP